MSSILPEHRFLQAPRSTTHMHTMEHPDETFEDALKRFQGSLTEKQRTEFKACSLQDVKDTIRKVETSLCAQRRQRNLQRMSRFVEGMNQLGQVVEVFLNVDATVAFVWAPIKFVLLVSVFRHFEVV